MKTIENKDLEPLPLFGSSGVWAWSSDAITSFGVDASGEEYQRKGVWIWLAKQERRQAPFREATVRQVIAAHKPVHSHKIDIALKSIAVLACAVIGVCLILLATV